MSDTRPVYQRIADDLRRQIDEGRLPVGSRLPSRTELKRVYAASDQTVDRAVRVLKAAGYAVGRFGLGVFVSDREPAGCLVRSTGAVDSPLAALLRLGGPGAAGPAELDWEAASATMPAPGPVAARLGIEPGDPVMRTQYEYLAGRRPLQLSTSWEPLALTEGTDVAYPERGPYARRGVRGRFAAIGIPVVRARESVGSRPATTAEAEALGCSPGQCVTTVERTHYAADGRAVETSDTVVPGDRWRLEYALSFGAPQAAAWAASGQDSETSA
ncbi:GntR family transcriptional regulator [Streptomyces sp. 7-21]|jgi:GntR family transcriptional regulator|uniref:GntR family transcriptional regulator n=1 Tax=Streptomyces sp. 7-21 TaxID=2802283 RepID=UPI00191D53B5|nr:GntR family transcriptional regulator [Streptomyces sp. 7-21]MBL1066990.1 GntR family transcriptional regulator [Streptomyces sp. 7-21]